MIRNEIMPARNQQEAGSQPFHRYELDDGTVWTEFFRTEFGYLLRFPGMADFTVSADGSAIKAYPTPDIDSNTLEHLYVNQTVPLALSRQGQPAFHASVVAVGGGAVAFLGESGAGKSTLAGSFALNGDAFLTDDALLVNESGGKCWAVPSHASVRLWDDSREALLTADCPVADAVSYTPKARILAGDALAYCGENQQLLAAFMLQSDDNSDIAIEPLSGLERYMGWLKQSFLLDIEDHDLLARHFEWTHRISDSVPTFALHYPHDYGILPALRDTIRKHVRQYEK